MNQLHIRTSGGVFGVIGNLHLDRKRPVLLIVNGSFPHKDYLHDTADKMPGANVLLFHLPGTGYDPGVGPPWTPTTVPGMTAGLGEAITRLVGDLPLIVYGASTGNLLALGLQLPNIVRKLAVEPFFTTAGLWPFIDFARSYIRRHPHAKDEKAYLEAVFGIMPDGTVENRDYRYLADLISVPTDVLVGGMRLSPRRQLDAWPSLVSEEDRALLEANPRVTMHFGGPRSGHGVAVADPGKSYVDRLLHRALLEASQLCV